MTAINEGDQTVTIRFHESLASGLVNYRNQGVIKTGIYDGGRLSIVSSSAKTVSLTPFIVEISDGTYQVRVVSTSAVTKTLASATPYLILRWAYSGSDGTDYAEISAVASGSITDTDIVFGHGTFHPSTGYLTGISYTYRTKPNTHDDYLKVIPTDPVSTSVQIKSGVAYTAVGYASVADQSLSLSGYSVADVVYIYLSDLGAITSSKTQSDYAGRPLLAVVTVPSGSITADDIVDVRSFVSHPCIPDDSTIRRNTSTGKLELVGFGTPTATDTDGNAFVNNYVYKAQCDGFMIVGNAYVGTTNPPTDFRVAISGATWELYPCPVPKNYYVKPYYTIGASYGRWIPLGTGGLVKQ